MADTFTQRCGASRSYIPPSIRWSGLRPHLIQARARRMLAAFPGDVLYAVKCNDAPEVLQRTVGRRRAPVRHRLDRRGAGGQGRCCRRRAAISCTRSRASGAIAEAYHEHGVRRFVFDHPDELAKIVAATGCADDLELFVRLAVPGEGAMLALTGKFGVGVDGRRGPGARRARLRPARWASPSMSARNASIPRAYARAIALAAEVVRQVGPVDDLDVGGGFPARYQGDEPAFEAFVAAIREAVARARARPAGCSASRAGRWSPTAPRRWRGSSCAAATASISTTASTATWPS